MRNLIYTDTGSVGQTAFDAVRDLFKDKVDISHAGRSFVVHFKGYSLHLSDHEIVALLRSKLEQEYEAKQLTTEHRKDE